MFYQHPDLMRSLCVHETVMAIMVNRLNKSKQEQTSMNETDGLKQTSETGENLESHPTKVYVLFFVDRNDALCLFRMIKLNLSQLVVNFYHIFVEHQDTTNEPCSNI